MFFRELFLSQYFRNFLYIFTSIFFNVSLNLTDFIMDSNVRVKFTGLYSQKLVSNFLYFGMELPRDCDQCEDDCIESS